MIFKKAHFEFLRNASRRFFLLLPVVVALLLFSLTLRASEKKKTTDLNAFIWPTSAARSLSSTFGETRDGHYHFGIDIKTNGREGFPCYAVADGDVVRVRVSPYGYGKALYLQLADGRTAVYAHLQKFAPDIESLVISSQYEKQQYRTQLWFKPGELHFQQGDLTAYTGSTGIGYPHLHFEMRDEEGYINAMKFGFTVPDTRPPVLTKLALIPLDIEAEINRAFDPVIYRLSTDKSSGSKSYVLAEIPELTGNVGLAVSGYDQANGAKNKLAFYGMVLYIDDHLRFAAHYDEIGFYETKQIELERDFRLRRAHQGVFHHLWRDEHVTANFYRVADGAIRSGEEEPGRHHFTIIVNDYRGNTATITGQFDIADSSAYPPILPYSLADGFFGAAYQIDQEEATAEQSHVPLRGTFFDDYVTLELAHDSSWVKVTGYLSSPFESTIPLILNEDRWLGKFPLIPVNSADWTIDIVIEDSLGLISAGHKSWTIQPIPMAGGSAVSSGGRFQAQFGPDDLYQPIYCRVEIENQPRGASFVSPIYHLEPHDVPIKGNAALSFAISPEEPHAEQLGLYYLSKKGEWQFIDNDLKKLPGRLYGETPALESYVVMRDDEAPTLRWLAPSLTTNDSRPTIRIKAEDELSGVDDRSVRLLIDGQWTLLEYDFETDILFGSPRFRLAPGDHAIDLVIADYNGNEAIMKKTLTITTP